MEKTKEETYQQAMKDILSSLEKNKIQVSEAIFVLERTKFQLFEFHLHQKAQKTIQDMQLANQMARNNGGFKQV